MATTLTQLRTPEKTQDSGLFTQAGAPQVQAWLEELPRGNPETCGRRLLEMLQQSNRTPLRRMERFTFAEQTRPSVYDICDALVRRYRGKPLPLPAAEESLAQLVRDLYEELANAFKLALNKLLAKPKLTGEDRNRLLLATQRTLLAHGRSLLEAYRIYAPAPPLIWTELHALYTNAETLRLQALPIEGTRDAEETALSIKQAYLRTLVLALSNPYHLMLGEAEELYKRIGRWVHFVQIRPPQPGETLQRMFVVDLDSDLPPRFLASQKRASTPKDPRVLVLDDLVDTLGQQVDNLNSTLQARRAGTMLSERMQRDMYSRFRNALGGRQERGAERRPTVAKLRLADGLSASHHFLADGVPFNPEEAERRWREKLSGTKEREAPRKPGLALAEEGSYLNAPVPGESRTSRFRAFDREVDDVWKRAHAVEVKEEKTDARGLYRAEVWSRKNVSDGGMALFCPEKSRMQTRVGELVCWTDSPLPRPPGELWQVGVIRWLRTRSGGGVELGVQQLAKTALAVGCFATRGPGSGAEYLRGLILPRVNPMKEEATLVTPAAVFDVGTVMAVNLQQLVIYVELTEMLETTRLFSHFRFKPAQPPA